ncbi:hypothetical protein N7491_011192 [Penicillium cf. griseofulvum]|nr:hypothetical protein N7491_011192 [Penicillium cf. griseofulvum]
MHLFLILYAFGSNVAALASFRPPELRVTTSSGLVNGIYNNSARTVRGFIGIPYAEPPIQELRWAPPRPKSPRSHIDASSFRSPCPQVHTYSNESIWSVLPYKIWNPGDMSVYMNIWAPSVKHPDHKELHAVMMFIHGRCYDPGGSSVAYYDGTDLVQNHDRLAIVWVHQNIARFGGDQNRILLLGQSAGAASADIYSYAYPDDPLVSAVALESPL